MIRHFPLLVLMLFSCLACRKGSVESPEELIQYVANENNGLSQARMVGEVQMKLSYRPTDLLVWQDVRSTGSLHDSIIEGARQNFGAYDYFVLSLSINGNDYLFNGTQGLPGYSELLQKLSFRMREHARVYVDNDTLPLADSYFVNQYGRGQATQVLLIFRKTEGERFAVDIEDLGTGIGHQRFEFLRSDIEKIPQLDFKKINRSNT